MLHAAVSSLRAELPPDTEYHVFSLYPSRDESQKQEGVNIVPCSALSLILLLVPLSAVYYLCSWFGPARKLLFLYRPLRVLARSDVLLDLSGISFVDGRSKTLIYNVACILPALLTNTPVFKMSQALGPFKRFPNGQLARVLLERLELIFARGSETARNLEDLGLDNFKPAADLAFIMSSEELTETDEELVIGVVPSQVMLKYSSNKGIDYLSVLADTLNWILDRKSDCRVVVIAHSNLGPGVSSRNNDYRICVDLHGMLPADRTELIVEELGPEELREEIGRCSVCIASRFHGMISALCTQTPVLVTAWSHKYREVLDMFGCGGWAAGFDELNFNRFSELLSDLIEQRLSVRESIRTHLPVVRASAYGQIVDVASYIDDPLRSGTVEVRKTARKLFERFYGDSFLEGYLGYARSPGLRDNCASGGLVTALLKQRLDSGLSDGAIVACLEFGDDGPVPVSRLVRSSSELKECSGSVYSDFNHVKGIRRIISNNDGVFDIVVLPCQARILRTMMNEDPDLAARIGLCIGLWCGHITDIRLLHDLLDLWKVDGRQIEGFRYRKGHWRGRTLVELKDGSSIEKSFSRNYGLFQNLYVDSKPRCFSCTDHFAGHADLSFGDCWIAKEKRSNIKKTMALVISSNGRKAIQDLMESGSCNIRQVPAASAIQAQKRAVIWHTFGCSGRAAVGRMFGMNLKCDLDIDPRMNDYLSSIIILATYRLFAGPLRPMLMRLPWWALYPVMAFQKLTLNR